VDGKFTVGIVKEKIKLASHPVADKPFSWHRAIPIKVSSFVWRARDGKIPVATALCKRDIQLQSNLCGACIDNEENADHALINCPFARQVWMEVLDWCGVQSLLPENVMEALELVATLGNKRDKLTSFRMAIIYGTIWYLWRARNDRVFNSIRASPSTVIGLSKSQTFLWIKRRLEVRNLEWSDWEKISLAICNCLG